MQDVTSTTRSRPIGVTIIAILLGILSGGLLSIIIVIYMLVDRNVREAFRF